jgi:hypothetical protein
MKRVKWGEGLRKRGTREVVKKRRREVSTLKVRERLRSADFFVKIRTQQEERSLLLLLPLHLP